MKLDKLFLILGIVSVSLGGVLFIAGATLTLLGNSFLGDLFMGISSLLGIAAIVLIIIRLSIMAKNPSDYPEYQPKPQPKVVVKVVDVKEVPKTREEQLYEQYEDLYKKNLITKEDLDKKRIELLGK